MSNSVIAFDLGGTNLRFAVVDHLGNITHRADAVTPRDADAAQMIELLVAMTNDQIRSAGGSLNIVAIGAAVPAIVNEPMGVLTKLPNLPALNGYPLRQKLFERSRIPVTVINDASAAALGENWMGASRGSENSICITLGTGVGGGLILNGRSYRGVDGTAGEVGHICVEPDGLPCGCGSNGCVEQYASANAILRMARSEGIDANSAKDVFEFADSGDPIAISIFGRMGSYLGIAVADLVNILNPETVVIGGGVSAAWAFFIDALKDEGAKRSFQLPWERVNIVRAELGDDAGLLGAARSAFTAT